MVTRPELHVSEFGLFSRFPRTDTIPPFVTIHFTEKDGSEVTLYMSEQHFKELAIRSASLVNVMSSRPGVVEDDQ